MKRSNAKYQAMHIINNNEVRNRTEELLYDDVSPENVSGRIKKEFKLKTGLSGNSIRRYIKSVYGRKIEYHRLKLKYKNRSKIKLNKLEDRINISKRSKMADNRKRIGDAEGDFIVSGRGGKGHLLVVIDRKSRAVFLEKIEEVNILNTHKSFIKIKERYSEMKTLTLDNDILFKKHSELSKLLKVKIYFCNPYHSWEKGAVENTNKYIRRYIKKRSDISQYTEEYIQSIEDKLNRRPMKCLSYSTPQEILDKHRNKKKH